MIEIGPRLAELIHLLALMVFMGFIGWYIAKRHR
jgi:hypothetical protein